MRRLLPLSALLLIAVPAAAQPDRLPPDLTLVPEDGLGFVHVRVAELWGHDSLKDVREIVKKAGDRAITALDQRFAGLPSNVERLTVWAGPTRLKNEIASDYLFVVRLARPADAAALRKLLAPEAVEKKGKRFAWYKDELGASLLIADDRTFVLGPDTAVGRVADGESSKDAQLRDALAVAAGGRPLVVGVHLPALPADWQKSLRDETAAGLRPVLDARSAAVSLDLAGEGHLHVRLTYADAAAAGAVARLLKAADGPAHKLIAEARRELEDLVLRDDPQLGLTQMPIAAAATLGLGVLKRAEEVLASDQVRADGPTVEAAVELSAKSKTVLVPLAFAAGAGIGAGATLSREMAHARHTNDLKQLLLAFHNSHDVFGEAEVAIRDDAGKPLLSWRVAFLPFVEQDNLYKQFKLDQPWDSEHNKKLIAKMPKFFKIEGVDAKPGYTHYRTFVGPKAPWAFDRPARIPATFEDGTSNTVVFVQAAEPVIWTKPDELEFDGKQAVKSRLLFRGGRTIVGMADGSVRVVRDTVKEEVWKLLIDPADGQPIPEGVLRK